MTVLFLNARRCNGHIRICAVVAGVEEDAEISAEESRRRIREIVEECYTAPA